MHEPGLDAPTIHRTHNMDDTFQWLRPSVGCESADSVLIQRRQLGERKSSEFRVKTSPSHSGQRFRVSQSTTSGSKRERSGRAGTPATMSYGFTSRVRTAPAPTIAPSP